MVEISTIYFTYYKKEIIIRSDKKEKDEEYE